MLGAVLETLGETCGLAATSPPHKHASVLKENKDHHVRFYWKWYHAELQRQLSRCLWKTSLSSRCCNKTDDCQTGSLNWNWRLKPSNENPFVVSVAESFGVQPEKGCRNHPRVFKLLPLSKRIRETRLQNYAFVCFTWHCIEFLNVRAICS